MLPEVLPYLSCPTCATDKPLHLSVAENGQDAAGDVLTGTLSCPGCGTDYPIIDALPYLLVPDKLAEIGHRVANEPATVFDDYRTSATQAVARTLQRLSRGCRISVDVGCGRGPYTDYFDGDLICVDLFPQFLRDMRGERGTKGLHYVVADARQLPLRKHVVDVIFCSNTLEHLTPEEARDAVHAFQSLARRHVLVDVPNGDEGALITRLRHLIYRTQSLTETHHEAHPELDHHSTFTAQWFQQQGYTPHGCIGWVSRRRFKWLKPVWDMYDIIAWGNPSVGGTLMAHYRGQDRVAARAVREPLTTEVPAP